MRNSLLLTSDEDFIDLDDLSHEQKNDIINAMIEAIGDDEPGEASESEPAHEFDFSLWPQFLFN